MVELSRSTAITIAAGGGIVLVVLLLALASSVRRWRGAARRLSSISARLDVPGPPVGDDRDHVGRLEGLAQAAVLRLSDAEARAERLAGALQLMGQGVVVCDEQGNVVFSNAAADQLGAAEGAGAGQGADTVQEVLRGAIGLDDQAGSVSTADIQGPPPRTLRVQAHPIDDGRRVVGAAAIVDEVSEQRRLDLIRRDFLTNVTAELKAPLGSLGLLAGTIVAEDDPVLTRRLASRLEHEALRVGRLVDDLIELSHLDAQALPRRDTVSVHLLAAQAIEEARASSPSRLVSMDVNPAATDLKVVGDRRQLVSALRHLVENALKFSPDGADVRVDVTARDGWVDVAVSDSGAGIPDGDLDRIFECFYRVEHTHPNTSPGADAGAGVGLAIASRVASGHGGQVLATSEEGKGSTFTLRIPVEREAGASPVGEEHRAS